MHARQVVLLIILSYSTLLHERLRTRIVDNTGNRFEFTDIYSEGMLGIDIKPPWDAPSLGDVAREAEAELGVLKGHGSPWKR